jgi:serine/threonine protein kinase
LADCISDYDKVEQDNFLHPEEVLHIARDLLLLLKNIHSQGKILFSIKPENIYFSSESIRMTNSKSKIK